MLGHLSLLVVCFSAVAAFDGLGFPFGGEMKPPHGGLPFGTGRPSGPHGPLGPRGPHGPGPHGPHGPGSHGSHGSGSHGHSHEHSHGSSSSEERTRPTRRPVTRRPVTGRPVTDGPVTDQPQPGNQTQSVGACGLCTADSITIPTVDQNVMTTWFSLDEITQGIDGCLVRMMTCMSSTGIQTVVSFNDDTSGTVSGMGNVSIDLNCNDDSEWTYMRNGVTEVITTISCLTA